MAATTISAAMSTITMSSAVSKKDLAASKKKRARGGRPTNPLQFLSVSVTELVFEDRQQVCNDVQTFVQESDALVHLEVGSDGLVHRLQLRLDPEQLRRVEDGAVEMDVDAEDEELADLHVDLRAAEGDLARQRDLRGDIFTGVDG